MDQFSGTTGVGGVGFDPASLGKYANNCAPPGQGQEIGVWDSLGLAEPVGVPGASRRAALALRERLWSVSSLERVRKCGKVPHGFELPLVESPGGGYRLTGLCTCHSVWACPICAPEIRAAWGGRIAAGILARLGDGGGVSFGTSTLSHAKAQPLRSTYGLVVSCWHAVSTDKSVRKFRKAHGWSGFIRTSEVTWGQRSGWHPHMHWLDWWEDVPSSEELRSYQDVVYGAWSRAVVRIGGRYSSPGNGVLVLPVSENDDSEKLGNYLTDITPRSAAFELTSISTKAARLEGMAPFQLLAKVYGPGSKPWVDLWWEYEQATKGRRMIGASRGLLAALGIDEDDPEPGEAGEVVAVVYAEDWSKIRWFTSAGLAGVQAILEQAAAGGQMAVNAAVRLLLGLDVAVPGDSTAVPFDFDRVEDSF